MGVRLYFKLINFSLFRWGGEYTWVSTGPASIGLGEPIPLPTTIIGGILGTKPGRGLGKDGNDALNALSMNLQCDVKALRGPYYPYRKDGIAIHLYSGGLLCIDGEGVISDVIRRQEILVGYGGTALRRNIKIVRQGMLYRILLLDSEALREKGINPQISMDLVVNGTCQIVSSVKKLGGDMRLAILNHDGDTRLLKLLRSVKSSYYVVASPILLEGEDACKLLSGECIILGKCRLCPPKVSEVRSIVGEELTKTVRVKAEILSPGVYGDTGFPREPYVAILPSSLLRVECEGGHCIKELERGLGYYSCLGFGTLVPIRGFK